MTSLKMWFRVAMVVVVAATTVSSSLVTSDPQPCTFAGNSYNHGQMIKDLCVMLVCFDGVWQSEWILTNPQCRCCEVFGDPHFSTFDNLEYRFQGSCNYSLAQMGSRMEPPMGIFGQFQDHSGAACLGTTTYKENANTVITLSTADHTTVEVNGATQLLTSAVQSLGSSVLASKNTTCSIMVGESQFVIKHCKNYLAVCAPLSLHGQVEGLCGHFDNRKYNDFTDRRGVVHDPHPSPRAFPVSWRTQDQPELKCSRGLLREDYITENNDEWAVCDLDPMQTMKLGEKCYKTLSEVEGVPRDLMNTHQMACVEDLCMMVKNGQDRDVDPWLDEAKCALTLAVGTHERDLGVQCEDPDARANSFTNYGREELSS